MKKKYYYLQVIMCYLIFGMSISITAQNLVPNAGFEVQDTCPAVSQITLAQPWNSPSSATPDLFNNTCSSQQGSPRTGIGCSGVFAYSVFANNREYIQVQLTSPLVSGETYQVSFYVKRNTFFTYAVDRLGVYFSNTQVNVSVTAAMTSFTPQVEYTNMLDGTGYTLVSGNFIASGGEQYMLIGNFKDDANTTILDVENGSNLSAFYYIDDIDVSLSNGINDLSNKIDIDVYPNPSNGMVTIEIGDYVQSSKLFFDVIDVNGRVVLKNRFENNFNKKIDLSSFERGLYIVRIYLNNQFVGFEKIMLQY